MYTYRVDTAEQTQDNVDTLTLATAALRVGNAKKKRDYLLFSLVGYMLVYTLVTVLVFFSLLGKIQDAYITPEACASRQDARTAIRLAITKAPGTLTAEDFAFINMALPAEVVCK